MKEDNKNIDYAELIAKYLSSNASDAEVQQLETWVLSSSDNKAQFLALKQTWALSGMKKMDEQINVNQEWKSVAGQLFPKGKVLPLQPKRLSGFFLKIAAAVAILLAASLWVFWPTGYEKVVNVHSDDEVKEQQLSDGTQIALNQFSTALYYTNPDGSRQVSFSGDGFFDVARDTSHPFFISTTSDVNIEVLGTSFYVDSRDDQEIVQVIVTSGTVAMKAGNQEIVLTKDEVGSFVKASGQLTKKQNDDANYLAWKTNILVYDNKALEKVIYDLNRTFHAKVSLAPGLEKCSITATYERLSLESIVRIIEKTLTLKAAIDGEQIIFSGQPCD